MVNLLGIDQNTSLALVKVNCMTVRELLARLNSLPKNARVCIDDGTIEAYVKHIEYLESDNMVMLCPNYGEDNE